MAENGKYFKDDVEAKLQADEPSWWNSCPPPGSENTYQCEACKHFIVTVDRDRGVTPMLLSCDVWCVDGCNGTMVSGMYPKGPKPKHIPEPDYEWIRPKSDVGMSPEARRHYLRGGLTLRRIIRGSESDS